jgi:Fur family ferric uptake transcriptional regulator
MNEENRDQGWPQGLKKTKPRALVMAALEEAERPMSATEILSAIEKAGESAWISTVYRVLELFTQKDVVSRLAMRGSDMAVYELNRIHHRHYAVCVRCRKVIPMLNCPMDAFLPNLDDHDFHVLGHNLEIYGYCRECNPKLG